MKQKQEYPLISILIPVYNSEKFLRGCLDSALVQTYSHLEILCVDDSSTDGSLGILKEYAARDKRVRVLEPGHLGIAGVRALLIKEARGKYISFLDSDDELLPEFVSTLYEQAYLQKADIVRCLYELLDIRDGKRIPCEQKYKEFLRPVPSQNSAARIQAALDDSQVWQKLIRTDFIRKHQIGFLQGAYSEDISFEILLYLLAQKIVFVDKHLYIYRVGNNQSLSAKKSAAAKGTLQNMIYVLDEVKNKGLSNPDIYAKLSVLTLQAVRRMRKYPLDPTAIPYYRVAFQVIQKQIVYCRGWNKFKLLGICFISRFLPDRALPWFSLLAG